MLTLTDALPLNKLKFASYAFRGEGDVYEREYTNEKNVN